MKLDIERLRIIEPNVTMKKAFEDFCNEFGFDDYEEINGIGRMAQGRLGKPYDFCEGVERCQQSKTGEGDMQGWVPCSTYWLVDDADQIHGTINLRHRLNEFLEREGGHLGYSIRPSSRRQGCATLLIYIIKKIAMNKGINRLLVTCSKDNIASQKVIKKCGGKKYDELQSDYEGGRVTYRYWIDL